MFLSRKPTRRNPGGPSLAEAQHGSASLNRSPTQRRGGADASLEQKKGYDRVQQGMKLLYPTDTERATDMDIVFVPGLRAHPEDSWKSKKGFNWASDKNGIARDFPNARILLYMYESSWIGPIKVKQSMENLGYTLLECLNSNRKDPESPRPIIFIGHSMGGLVIAKAVCLLAHARQHMFPRMFEDIVGCAFFGTPFEGAEAASLAAMASGFGERFDMTVASKLIPFMKPKNEALMELKNNFIRLATKLDTKMELYGFFEKHPTKIEDLSGVPQFIRNLGLPLPKKMAQFVTEESAILGGNMESIGLAANHRDLVKFESPEHELYALVQGPLKRLVSNAHHAAKSRRQTTRRVDKDLVKKAKETLEGAQVKRKLQGMSTAPSSWIPKEPQYMEWLAKIDGTMRSFPTKRGDCLWIRGPEGRGKTSAGLAALRGIEEMINAKQPSALFAYFLCDSAQDYDTAEDLLKSLILQLIEQQEEFASHCKFLLRYKGKEDSKAQPQLTVENLWQVLRDILSDTSLVATRIYFVVNNLEALQEGSASTRTFLKHLGDEIASMDGRNATVRWLVTSDQSWEIEQALKGDSVRLIDLEHEKYKDQVKSELQKHARERVSDLVTRRNYSKALAYYAGSLIGKRAQNTQWIDIIIIQLEQLPEHDNDRYVRRHLEVIPEKLDELLNSAWRRVFELNAGYEEEIKELLRILVLTFEDPTIPELRLLTGLYASKEETEELDGLVDRCKPLLGLKQKEDSNIAVCFINNVVKEHLSKNSYRLLGLSEEGIKLQHGMLGLQAFTHVMETFNFPEKTSNPEDDQDGREDDDDTDGENSDKEGDDSSNPSNDSYELDSDDESEDEDPEAPILIDRAQPYAVKHWLSHASKATVELAESLSLESEFWERGSIIRRRWLTEHNRLTDSFQCWERSELSGLHVAAAIGFRQLVAALINNGYEDEKDLRDSVKNTPLHFAAIFGNSDIIEELLSRNVSINDGIDEGLETPLYMAALEGRVNAMEKLLHRGADPEASCQGQRAIHAAITSGNRDAVELLVERDVSLIAGKLEDDDGESQKDQDTGSQINRPEDGSSGENKANSEEDEDEDGDDDESDDEDDEDDEEIILSPLALAASRADTTMLEFLLSKYKQKLPLAEFDAAIDKAAEYGRLEAVHLLLASYTASQYAFQISLHSAALKENWDIVELLLEKCPGLDCNFPFWIIARGNDNDQELHMLEAIWEYTHRDMSSKGLDEALYQATDYENAKTIEILLRFGADANATGEEYGNALTASAHDGTMHILKMLLDAGAEINSPNGWALQTASAHGHRDIVELLLQRGANVNAYTEHKNMTQATALQAAVETGKDDIVELLLEHGADPNLGGGEFTRPVIAAARLGEAGILAQLVQARADLDVFGGRDHATPLNYAARFLPLSSVRLLLDAGADINLADEDGDTALTVGTWGSEPDCIRLLLDRGADVFHRSKSGKNALQIALELGKPECARVLADHVSAILEALRVAMESGDASVAAVIRSAQNRNQGLDYDEPAAAGPDGNAQQGGTTLLSAVADATEDWSLWNNTGHVRQDEIAEASQAGSGVPGHGQITGNSEQHHPGKETGATGLTMRQPPNPTSHWQHESAGVALDEAQRFTHQQIQHTPPPLASSYPTPPPSSGAVRRKPLTTPSPEQYGAMPPSTTKTQFPNQPVHHTGPQGPIAHQPQQPYYPSGQGQQQAGSVGPHESQFQAYQPQPNGQLNSAQTEGRVSFQHHPPQQYPGQSPLPPGQQLPQGTEPRFQAYNPGTQGNGTINRPQRQSSRTFLGMNMPWAGDGHQ